MQFNSLSFAIFIPAVFLIYWILPHKSRWILLLLASYIFYMSWSFKCVLLILFTTVISYFAAILIENFQEAKKTVMVISSLLCLAPLFLFKYLGFMLDTMSQLFSVFSINLTAPTLNLLLPVGISFYTFQTLSYIIDVYRKETAAEHHFGYYAVFISFFPQLVAGPIERVNHLLPQIKANKTFDYHQAVYGVILMTWGYFKKTVIADTLSLYVNNVFSSPKNFNGFSLVLAIAFFTIEIYCDFSGYSDIAIGTAKLMGINLSKNFSSPYFSRGVKEFWGRWHISLSSFFKDYLYIPLGGSHVPAFRYGMNIMLTFLISGLWHGANWTFVIWGGIHGLAQIVERFFFKDWECDTGIAKCFRTATTFIFVSFAWAFFVSDSVTDAFYVIGHMFRGVSVPFDYLRRGFNQIGMAKASLFSVFFPMAVLTMVDGLSLRYDCIEEISKKPPAVRYVVYLFLICLIFSFREPIQAEFIYFQF